jgi:tetratricopeptide (TPR) repeat protein
MYKDHPLGVGGGNFYVYYPTYKIWAAPETVKDPHNFVLSFLTQYGPVGLLGFLAAVFCPLLRRPAGSRSASSSGGELKVEKGFARLVWRVLPVTAIAMLAIRSMVLKFNVGTDVVVATYIIGAMLVLPVLVFAGAFLLASLRDETLAPAQNSQAILFCGLAGVLLHNCIDFALFEPGVLAVFWATLAAFVAGRAICRDEAPLRFKPARTLVLAGWLATAAVAAAFAVTVLLPVPSTEWYMQRADEAIDMPDIATAHEMLARAETADVLNPEPPYQNGRLYLFDYQMVLPEPNYLAEAEYYIREAIRRAPAYYKYHSKLAELYATAAQTARGRERTDWLQKAYVAAKDAIARYPGDAALHITLGDIADEMGNRSEAAEEYRKAVEIEDAYRGLFVLMYPDRPLFSRVGEDKYQYARSRIAELTAGSTH